MSLERSQVRVAGLVKGYPTQHFLKCFIEYYSLYTPVKRYFPEEVTEKSKMIFWFESSPNFDVLVHIAPGVRGSMATV